MQGHRQNSGNACALDYLCRTFKANLIFWELKYCLLAGVMVQEVSWSTTLHMGRLRILLSLRRKFLWHHGDNIRIASHLERGCPVTSTNTQTLCVPNTIFRQSALTHHTEATSVFIHHTQTTSVLMYFTQTMSLLTGCVCPQSSYSVCLSLDTTLRLSLSSQHLNMAESLVSIATMC